jgi:phage tail sheath gpL-like
VFFSSKLLQPTSVAKFNINPLSPQFCFKKNMAAVGSERISKVVGYQIKGTNFSNTTPNLPQRIAILAEANEANQSAVDFTIAHEMTTAQQAGAYFGYGSPIYHIMRILKPINSDGVGGIPIVVYPQAKAGGAASKILRITPSGTATANATHSIFIAGRDIVDGQSYDINIENGDTVADICQKIQDAVNGVLGSPVTAANYAYDVDLESKWKGLTANDLTVSVDTNDNAAGITYAVSSAQSGSGTPSISAALTLFGNDWNTIVINSYGTVSGIMSALEAFNGIPDPSTPTGRYVGTLMKPFIALTGSVADNDSATTDTHLNEVTIAICPAPLSKGLPLEAAANMAALFARQAQDTPHLDVSGQSYPDMPTPLSIGTMADYDNRDAYVKKGNSTVDLNGGKYVVMDFVTTYHKLGELPPQFRYCRNIMIDLNIRFGYYLLEQINVVDHAIAADADNVSASSVVKPKQWKAVLSSYADDLASRSLIADAAFMQDSLSVALDGSNPDRLNTTFRYKRTGYARIAATIAEAGFNFGS